MGYGVVFRRAVWRVLSLNLLELPRNKSEFFPLFYLPVFIAFPCSPSSGKELGYANVVAGREAHLSSWNQNQESWVTLDN